MNADSEIGVLFLHHAVNPVVLNNLASIKRANPGVYITTISASDPLPGGYGLSSTSDLLRLHQINPRRASDVLVRSGFLQAKVTCEKWWIVEWDTYCSISIKEYYKPVWHFPFVSSAVYRQRREKDWPWFAFTNKLPIPFRRYAVGAVPFLYLISHAALKSICEGGLHIPPTVGNGELRFATTASKCGYPPCGFSPPTDEISWFQSRYKPGKSGIYHPIKRLLPNSRR